MDGTTIVGSSSMREGTAGISTDQATDLSQAYDAQFLLPEGAAPLAGSGAQEQNTVKSRMRRHFDSIAHHFNVLDRLFKRRNPRSESHFLRLGAGVDGVFSNLMAKPEVHCSQQDAVESDKLPTYDEAATDMVPPYYGIDDDGTGLYYNEICIDGLQVGSIVNFLWNMVVGVSFHFIGFLMTYALHTSHAAKQGSRFGLGVTFINYGYDMIPDDVTAKVGKDKDINRIEADDPNAYDEMHIYAVSEGAYMDQFESQLSHGLMETRNGIPGVAIALIIFGFLIVIKSVYDYIVVKRKERMFLPQSESQPV